MWRDTVFAMVNPDIPPWLVHFTGRPASFQNRWKMPAVAPSQQAEERLIAILTDGAIKAAVPHGAQFPAVCMSEFTLPAIEHQLRSGFTSRGPYQPWAVVLNKTGPIMVEHARPVLYLSYAEMMATNGLSPALKDRRVQSVPGERENDWTHEREWRMCWGADVERAGIRLDLPGTLRAIIVGRSGWTPHARSLHPTTPIPRWLWTGASLVTDGEI